MKHQEEEEEGKKKEINSETLYEDHSVNGFLGIAPLSVAESWGFSFAIPSCRERSDKRKERN